MKSKVWKEDSKWCARRISYFGKAYGAFDSWQSAIAFVLL